MSNRVIVNVSSKNRNKQSDSTSEFRVSFSEKNFQKVTSVKLQNFVMVNTIGNITKHNNTFAYHDGVGDVSVTLAVGQYTISELLVALSLALSLAPNPIIATFVIQPVTNKIECTASVPAINFYDYSGSVENPLGIAMGVKGISGLVGSYVFPNFVDLTGLDQIFINSRSISNEGGVHIESAFDPITQRIKNNRRRSYCIKVIPVDVAYSYKVNYTNDSELELISYDETETRNIQEWDFQLTDNQGRDLDLMGTEVFISFAVTYLD